MILVILSVAFAADVTAMPPALRGDVTLGYRGAVGFGSVREAGVEVSGQRSSEHALAVTAEFAPIDEASVWIRVDGVAASRLHFLDAHAMVFDPVTETGTYVDGAPLGTDDLVLAAGGVQGVWFGAGVAPFAERYGRGQHATWRLDAGVRAPSPGRTFWTERDGKRGVAPGGPAVALQGAFSVRRGAAEPYLVAGWTWEGRARVDVGGAELTVDPADHVDVRGGVELVAGEDPQTGERFAFDAYGSFAYEGWADVASGVLLPGALARTRGVVATRSDRVRAGVGIGGLFAPIEQFGARVSVDGVWSSPIRVEHLYPATSGFDTVEITTRVTLQGRIR